VPVELTVETLGVGVAPVVPPVLPPVDVPLVDEPSVFGVEPALGDAAPAGATTSGANGSRPTSSADCIVGTDVGVVFGLAEADGFAAGVV
jgi:hypothetical protein